MIEFGMTHHAIDRASIRLSKLYRRTRAARDEGIATWLRRRTETAIESGRRTRFPDGMLAVAHEGVAYIFVYDDQRLKLITVYPGEPKPMKRDDTDRLLREEAA